MARRGAKLGSAVLDLDIDDSKYTSNLDKQRQKTRSWVDTLGRDVKRGIGQGIGIGAGLGVANLVAQGIDGVKQVVAGSVQAAMEWESAFAGVRKTVDASEEEFGELEGGIREMAREMPIAATELAGLAEAAGALGVAKGDIKEFTRVTAMIGTTTDVSSDQAATSLGQLSNVLNLTSEDYERFGSTLVDLGNKGASTESQILEIASRAGAGSQLIGMATDETLAWASAVANLGIEAEAGGSSLQNFFLRSAAAIEEGGEKLETYARVAGMTGAEFKRAFQEDATGALSTFLAKLGELSQGEQLQVLADLDFNDVRITRTLLGLANNTDNLTSSLTTANEAWDENTALAIEAEKRYGTTESKLQILGNRVNDLAIEFGETLLPALLDLATFGVGAIEDFVKNTGKELDVLADSFRVAQIYFGDLGKGVEDRANEIGVSVGAMKNAVLYGMNELNLGLEDATKYAEQTLAGLPYAMTDVGRQTITNWKQADLGQIMADDVGAGVDGAEQALLDGEVPISDAANQLEEAMTAEMREARDNAIDAMRDALDGMTNLIESEEDLTTAWEDLLKRLEDPYTEAEREADTFSQAMIDNIADVIAAGDPKLTADTAALVNNMLTQFALLQPGALERGQAVPPALQDGMDTQMSALITWIEEHVTGEALTALTLTEAQELGLEGIWLYAQGMKSQKDNAVHQAGIIASRSVNALTIDATSGGRSIIATWLNGMTSYYWANRRTTIDAIATDAGNIFGRSLPRSGPLKGGVGSGGTSIGESWIDAMVLAIDTGLGRVRGSVGTVGDAFGFSIPSPNVADVDALTATGGFPSGFNGVPGGTNIVEYHLHYGGRERLFDTEAAFLKELKTMDRFHEEGA